MNSSVLLQTCIGFGTSLILEELALVHNVEVAETTTQEKTKAIALAAFAAYTLPKEIAPIFTGVTLGLSVELMSNSLKKALKAQNYTNIATLSAAIFLFHFNQPSTIAFFPLILGLGTASFFKQNRAARLIQQNSLQFLNLPMELHEEYEPVMPFDIKDNPMLCGNPPEIPLDPVLKRNDSRQVYDRKSVNDKRVIPLIKYKALIDDCLLQKAIDINKLRAAVAEFKGYETPPSSPRRRSGSRTRKT